MQRVFPVTVRLTRVEVCSVVATIAVIVTTAVVICLH